MQGWDNSPTQVDYNSAVCHNHSWILDYILKRHLLPSAYCWGHSAICNLCEKIQCESVGGCSEIMLFAQWILCDLEKRMKCVNVCLIHSANSQGFLSALVSPGRYSSWSYLIQPNTCLMITSTVLCQFDNCEISGLNVCSCLFSDTRMMHLKVK